MRLAFTGALALLGLSALALVFVWAYVSLGRSLGEEWSSLDGPAPVWPAAVGFGAMNAAALSLVVIALLTVVAGVRLGVLLLKDQASRG